MSEVDNVALDKVWEEIHAQGRSHASLSADVRALTSAVNSLVEKTKPIGPQVWVGIIVFAGSVFFGMTQYVSLQQQAPKLSIEKNREQLIEMQADIKQHNEESSYRYGTMDERTEWLRWLSVANAERSEQYGKAIAANEIKIRATGDYVKDIDQWGSRKWIGSQGE